MDTRIDESNWKSISIMGAISALLAVFAGIVEILISFAPGGSQTPTTVAEWFNLFQENRFLGLRDLGLINNPSCYPCKFHRRDAEFVESAKGFLCALCVSAAPIQS